MENPKARTHQHIDQFYENEPELYDEITEREDPENKILKILLKHYDFKNKTVLDLGAGTGRLVIPLSKESKLMYALDTSVPLLGILKKKVKDKNIKNIKILNTSYSKIPLPDNSLDMIISSWSFPGHSEDKESDLKEITRVLKEGGKIIIILSSDKGELQNIRKRVFKESLRRTGERLQWLRSKGFKKQTEMEIDVNFGTVEMTRKLGMFWGPHMVEYLLKRNKTSFKIGMSIFSFEKLNFV